MCTVCVWTVEGVDYRGLDYPTARTSCLFAHPMVRYNCVIVAEVSRHTHPDTCCWLSSVIGTQHKLNRQGRQSLSSPATLEAPSCGEYVWMRETEQDISKLEQMEKH